MKNIVSLLFFIMFISSLSAQTFKNKKIEKVGDHYEVTIYYDNGTVM